MQGSRIVENSTLKFHRSSVSAFLPLIKVKKISKSANMFFSDWKVNKLWVIPWSLKLWFTMATKTKSSSKRLYVPWIKYISPHIHEVKYVQKKKWSSLSQQNSGRQNTVWIQCSYSEWDSLFQGFKTTTLNWTTDGPWWPCKMYRINCWNNQFDIWRWRQ